MIVYPAIDLRAGQAVRLTQGDFARETVYDADPLVRAQAFVESGAEWLHVVDLDAARGVGDNREAVRALARLQVPTQVGGGVRDAGLLADGVRRLVVGSLLVKDRAAAGRLLEQAGGRVAFGLDHREGRLRISGWEADGGVELDDVLAWDEVRNCEAVIVTDIATDGMLIGPNLESLGRTVQASPVPVICSGGIGSLDDIEAVGRAGAAGVIVGRAIYEGRFTLEEALSVGAQA